MEAPAGQAPNVYTHFVTFTLQPHLYGKTARQQIRTTFAKANFELQRVAKSYHLVAELTKKANIHYHAMVEYDVNSTFDADDLSLMLQDNVKTSNVIGRTESEVIRDYNQTFVYLQKDIAKTNKIVNPRNKTTLEVQKIWTKTIEIKPIKISKLKDYLTLDDGIEEDPDFYDSIIKHYIIGPKPPKKNQYKQMSINKVI